MSAFTTGTTCSFSFLSLSANSATCCLRFLWDISSKQTFSFDSCTWSCKSDCCFKRLLIILVGGIIKFHCLLKNCAACLPPLLLNFCTWAFTRFARFTRILYTSAVYGTSVPVNCCIACNHCWTTILDGDVLLPLVRSRMNWLTEHKKTKPRIKYWCF